LDNHDSIGKNSINYSNFHLPASEPCLLSVFVFEWIFQINKQCRQYWGSSGQLWGKSPSSAVIVIFFKVFLELMPTTFPFVQQIEVQTHVFIVYYIQAFFFVLKSGGDQQSSMVFW